MGRNGPSAPSDGSFDWLGDVSESHRALVVRNRFDDHLVALDLHHERIVARMTAMRQDQQLFFSRLEQARLKADVEAFVITLRRTGRLPVLLKSSGLSTSALRVPLRLFENRVDAAVDLRNLVEHVDGATLAGQGGVGYGHGPSGMNISYNGTTLDTEQLLQAAHKIHRAVRARLDPLAQTADHYHEPAIELPSRLPTR